MISGRFPTFLVAGTQKAATTWVYECLHEHPQVLVPRTKELHFFCPKGQCWKSRADLGHEWYLSQFPVRDEKAWGELSVDYMFYPEVAATVTAHNPALRVLFILRDPSDRAYSAYWMNRRNKPDMPPFDDFVRADSDFVARGFYLRQIERYLALLAREQIKVMIYEDIHPDPRAFIGQVYEFLGVDPAFAPPSVNQSIAATRSLPPSLSRFVYRSVSPILQLPYVLPAWRAFKRTTGIKRSGGEARPSGYAPMSNVVRARLDDLYRNENHRLFDFLGREIPQWSK